jgi:hypothetical protein
MTPKGIYRTVTPGSGAEYAFVDYGVPSSLGELPRAQYEQEGYLPPFDDLPTKDQYFKPKTYLISLVSMPGTAQEITHSSQSIVTSTDDKAVESANAWVAQPGSRLGLPDGEYFLQVVRDGVGVRSIKIQVANAKRP